MIATAGCTWAKNTVQIALNNCIHKKLESKLAKSENVQLVSSLVIAGSIGSGTVGTEAATFGL